MTNINKSKKEKWLNTAGKEYILSAEESARIAVIKLMAIVFVVYFHSETLFMNFSDGKVILPLPRWLYLLETIVSGYLGRCGVPMFFLLSAVLLFKNSRSYIPTIQKKVKSILIPYLIWNTFWIMVVIVLQSLPFTAPYFSGTIIPHILSCSFKDWLGLYGIKPPTAAMPYANPHCYPLWFMRDLFCTTLFFPLIGKAASKFPRLSLLLGLVLFFIPDYFPYYFPLKIAIEWFLIGAGIVRLNLRLSDLDRIPVSWLSILYVVYIILTINLHKNYINYFSILFGIIFWFRISKVIYDSLKMRKYFLNLSQWTFMIFVFHELTLTSFKKVFLRMLPSETAIMLAEYLLLPILVIVICIWTGKLLKRFLPGFYRLATGNR